MSFNGNIICQNLPPHVGSEEFQMAKRDFSPYGGPTSIGSEGAKTLKHVSPIYGRK